jgi:diamine N-acetyltransferase
MNSHDGSVHLRPLERSDAGLVYELHNDESTRTQQFAPFPRSMEWAVSWIDAQNKSHESIWFTVQQGSVVAGIVGLKNVNWTVRKAEFSISLQPNMRGQGIGTKATGLMLDYAHRELGLHKVFLKVHADNEAAMNVYNKCGFRIEAKLAHEAISKGKYIDVYYMSVIYAEGTRC